MEKINFEDATLKKSAYVTIGGTEYPVTDAEYVGGVDLDAATLNYAFQLMHPVGSVYISTSSANPASIFGFGTWEPCCVGRFPLGVDENDPNIKRRKEKKEYICGYDGHVITNWYLPCPKKIDEIVNNYKFPLLILLNLHLKCKKFSP